MKRILITVGTGIAMLVASSGAALAQQPANARASCVAVITSYEASQLAPGFVGNEVSGFASNPGFGRTPVSPLALNHLTSIETCRQAEG